MWMNLIPNFAALINTLQELWPCRRHHASMQCTCSKALRCGAQTSPAQALLQSESKAAWMTLHKKTFLFYRPVCPVTARVAGSMFGATWLILTSYHLNPAVRAHPSPAGDRDAVTGCLQLIRSNKQWRHIRSFLRVQYHLAPLDCRLCGLWTVTSMLQSLDLPF